MAMSISEIEYCKASVQQGIRLDGRDLQDFRPIEIELGLIAQANGSSRLHLGSTDVLVGVKVEVGVPDSSRPNCGRVSVTVECSACASPDYEGRGGDEWGSQLASALESSLCPQQLSEGYGLDLRALNIVTGKSCWNLYIDALVLNDDGNVLDALSLAAFAALMNTRIPHVEITAGENGEEPEIELDDDMDNSVLLDLQGMPVIVSVAQIGNVCALDSSLKEESCSEASLRVAVNSKGRLCGVTKDGPQGLDPSMMIAMIETAVNQGPKLIRAVNLFVKSHNE